MNREEVLLEAEKFAPDYKKYTARNRDFTKLYQGDNEFYQIVFYDRRKDYTGVQTFLNVFEYEKDTILEQMNLYNEKLKELMDENYIEWFNKPGDNVGFCYISVHYRNRQKEEEEARLQEREWADYDEPECSSCGDGGCIHCEPHRFIEGYISY